MKSKLKENVAMVTNYDAAGSAIWSRRGAMATFACVQTNIAAPFITPPSTSNCLHQHTDSDCGSSSGVGGMKTQEVSDEAASSSISSNQAEYSGNPGNMAQSASSSVAPVTYTLTPPHQPLPPPLPVMHPPSQMFSSIPPPPGMQPHPINPTMATMAWLTNPPAGPRNTVFVHIQAGETLTLYNNGDPQHYPCGLYQDIIGPATIEMLGDIGAPQMPIPIAVPPGHQCHQIVDELGILRHVVLSIEPSKVARSHLSREPVPSISAPGQMPSYSGPPVMYNNRKWMPRNPPIQMTLDEENEQDSEENERLREMLSRVVMPQVNRVMTTEVDIVWTPIDTSEAASPGGPFPQIDASEFTYHATIYENSGRFVASYICDSSVCNKMRVGNLRPNTEYSVQIKASLEERGIVGDPSPHFFFRTAPGRPEAPLMPRVVAKGVDFVHLNWRTALNNGAAVNLYYIYVHPVGNEAETQLLQFGSSEGKIIGLKPNTTYRFRLTSVNAIGESYDSTQIEVTTRYDAPPSMPSPPTVTMVTNRSVRLMWAPLPECTFGVEMFDVGKKLTTIVRDRLTVASIHIGDLQPNSEYRFRLFARNTEGESPRSEWTIVRTQQTRHQNYHYHYNNHHHHGEGSARMPTTPIFLRYVNGHPEVGWKCYGPKDLLFNLEGSPRDSPTGYRTIYRGPATTYVVVNEDIHMVRVQSINKRGIISDFTDSLVVPRIEPENQIIEQLEPPEMSNLNEGRIRISWKPVVFSKKRVIYTLQRLHESDEPEIIYEGEATEHTIKEIGARISVAVRVRGSVFLNNSKKLNGEWSETSRITTMAVEPKCPEELKFNDETREITWKCVEEDVSFVVKIWKKGIIQEDQDELVLMEKRNDSQMNVSSLEPGVSYSFAVASYRDGCENNEFVSIDFDMPADVPNHPEAITVVSEGSDKLILKWTTGSDSGSPITSYRLKLFQGQLFIRESAISANPTVNNEFTIDNLEPNTHYRVEVSAENAIGQGPAVVINGRTKPLPPVAPRLECEPEATAMRIRWKNTAKPAAGMSYKLVRVNKNDQHMTVYEGENLTSKVKNLCQDTEYVFQIRATNKLTGTSVWSEPYIFRTLLAPPPTIRNAPAATQSLQLNGHYQIEWSNVLPVSNNRKQFYRLQVVESNDTTARWHTVYEGVSPSFLLKTSNYLGAIQARVFCVRIGEDGEMRGQASPVIFIMNEKKENDIQQNGKDIVMDDDDENKPWHKKIHKSLFSIIALLSFVCLAVLLANLCDWLFNLTQGGNVTPSVNVPPVSTYSPSPPSIPSKIIHTNAAHREL